MIMLKLIEANDSEINTINIEGTVEEFKECSREGKGEELTTARFTQQVLNVGSQRD